MEKKIGILGGGLAGLSFAFFLNKLCAILEAQEDVGGLCRSYSINGVIHDVGPHIIFSKDEQILNLMNGMIDYNRLKRSNQIYYRGRFVKYPFENFLAQIGNEDEISYCLNAFLNNPYENLPAENMLAFFLKTFGEGISRLYLQPYNQKIWKYDPCMIDTQMVERIPRPPNQHIIDAANGKYNEGYVHQLYFTYPKRNGIHSLCNGFMNHIQGHTDVITGKKVCRIKKLKGEWRVTTEDGAVFHFERIVNCMPMHEFIQCLEDVPQGIRETCAKLFYNSIYIIILNYKRDFIGDHFAVMFPASDIIFHRLSRTNFLGSNYCLEDGSVTLSLEITFREGDHISRKELQEIIGICISDLDRLGLAKRNDLNFTGAHREKYAYVIYDLNHRKNANVLHNYLGSLGVSMNGRFAEFEYLNMDQVISHSRANAEKFWKQK